MPVLGWETVLVVFLAIVSILLGYLVLRQNTQKKANRDFFTFSLCVGIIIFLAHFSDVLVTTNEPASFLLTRIIYGLVILMVLLMYAFSTVFPYEIHRLPYIHLPFIGAGIIGALIATFTNQIILDIKLQPWGFDVVPGPLFYALFLPITVVAIGAAFVIFLLNYLHLVGIRKAQMRYLLIGIGLFFFFEIFFNVTLPMLTGDQQYYRFGNYSFLAFIGFTSYAIVAHRLFDIRILVKKTVIYSGLLGFVIGAYSLVIFTLASIFGSAGFSRSTFLPNLIAALVVAAGFDPIRRWLIEVTDKYLFVAEYKPEEVLRELTRNLSAVIDLDEALQGMMQTVVKSMRLRRAATFVLRRFKGEIEVKRVKHIGFSNPQKLTLAKNDPLIVHFEERLKKRRDGSTGSPQGKLRERRHYALVTEELGRRIEEDGNVPRIVLDVHKRLTDLGAAVALPIIVKSELIGILILSEKLSGDIFTSSDLDLLEIVAHETAGAIEKARFWEEDQLKSEFVSIASHELLTPTSTILGYLSMILDEGMGKVDPKAREYLLRVRATSQRLTELVQDLLNVSRIESGRIKISPQPVNLLAVVRQVVEELAPQAREKGLSLHLEEPSRGGETRIITVFADPERTRQVLVNIIGNAVKYTPKGGVTVSIERAGRLVKTNIADTGVGISPEDKKHLFEKFYRIQNEATQGTTGTGLGLYIVKNIIELMGGTIGVESTPRKGSTFSFTLPMTETKHLEKK